MTDLRNTIRELEDRRYRAMCEADMATLDTLMADSMVYTHSTAAADGKAAYLAGVRSKKWVYRKIDRPVEDIQFYGDCAVVTGQVRIDILVEGVAKNLNSRFTNVWVKGAKGWQFVAWQSTPMPT